MLRIIVRALVVLCAVSGATAAFALVTGPPLSRTGMPAVGGKPAEPLCTICHNLNAPNLPDGQVEILDLPDSYSPGKVYPMRVRVTSTANESYPERRWGFELTAVYQANGLGAGTWIIPEIRPDSLRRATYPSASASTWKTRVYITHTEPSTYPGATSPQEWSFAWVAPPVDSGTVLFFVAGNAANGDLGSLGTDDHIYTARDTVLAPVQVGVHFPPSRGPYHTSLEPPFPNPMRLCGDISFELARAGNIDLAVFDVQGRRLRTIMRGWHDAGPGFAFWDGKRENGEYMENGVYFVRLRAPGEPRRLTRRVAIAR
jgi:hypothetical protein